MSSSELQFLSEQYHVSIEEDTMVEERALRNLAARYSKTRLEIHVSDLTLCMRQSLLRKIKPVPPTEKQLGYFLDGSSRHVSLQTLYADDDVEGKVVSEKKGEDPLHFSIDIYDDGEAGGLPIEFKSTRAAKAISEHWVRQVIYYMLLTGRNEGIIQVQRIMPRDGEKIFPAFRLKLSEEQYSHWLKDLEERLALFKKAFDFLDASMVPAYPGDGNWLCRECPYKEMNLPNCPSVIETPVKAKRKAKN